MKHLAFIAKQTALSTNPRRVLPFWQQAAHRAKHPDSGFAIARALGNSAGVPDGLQTCTHGGQDCYPFPSPWSGPARAGPFYPSPLGAILRNCANCLIWRFFRYDFAQLAVESPVITTNNRGRKSSCAIPLSYWPFFPCLLQVACKTQHRAALPGLRQVQRLPILPTTTRLPVRLLAVWRGQQLAASTSVCRPAIDLISAQTAAIAAFRATRTTMRPTGQVARLVVFFVFGPKHAPFRSLTHV